MKIGLVLAGGGGRGAYHIGVWKALREAGLDQYVSAISGTSVGGLNAALFLQGDLERAEEIWKNLSVEKILTPRNGFHADLQHTDYEPKKYSGLYLYIREGLLKIIEENLDTSIFDKSEKNCYMTCRRTQNKKDRDSYEEMFTHPDGTKDCKIYVNGRATYFNMRGFSDRDRIKILLATSAMPFIFPKEKIGDCYYMDGGWTDNLPVEPLYRIEKCDRIVVVHLTTNDGRIKREQFPAAKIFEIRPQKEQGGFFAGILDFRAQSAADRIQQGYHDTIKMFQDIREDIKREAASGRRWEEALKEERKARQSIEQGYFAIQKKMQQLGW